MQPGADWFMSRAPTPRKRRFSVTLTASDYDRLKAIASAHRPPLSLRFVAERAIIDLLQKSEDPQFALDLANPSPRP